MAKRILPYWTVRQAADWSGIPLRVLYRLLAEGAAPSVPVGNPWKQQEGARKRACFLYVIPKTAFMKWFESGAPIGERGNSAA